MKIMDIIWTLVCVLTSLFMIAMYGYGLYVLLEVPKQGLDSEFKALLVGLSPMFAFAGMMLLVILLRK